MYINFKKVVIHNFLSYGHAEIDLTNKNYCLVRGINNNPVDNALSNGSGKSTWSSAICWCLTGETINGLHSNLKNIFIDENSCYVTLYFSVDKDSFVVTRYLEPKSDLRLTVNGEDKSGKGIRETSVILAQYLPDLTSQLLGSIIILGQGLPCKFTANTPSGRKEVLEKLSKSDFMIQDIKNRLAKVIDDNNKELRTFEDQSIKLNSEKAIYLQQRESKHNELLMLEKPVNFDGLISELESNILKEQNLVKSSETVVKEATAELEKVGNTLNELLLNRNKAVGLEDAKLNNIKGNLLAETEKINGIYNTSMTTLSNEYNATKTDIINKTAMQEAELSANINSLSAEILRLDSIKDVCPTCGQKLIGVTKPDTTAKKQQLAQLKENLTTLTNQKNNALTEASSIYTNGVNSAKSLFTANKNAVDKQQSTAQFAYNNAIQAIDAAYRQDSAEANFKYKELKDKIDLYSQNKRLKENKILELNTQLTQLKVQKDNHQKQLDAVKAALLSIDNKLEKLESEILYNNNERSLLENKLAIDNKINTLVKRDFRGFLLSNIINFINSKAKEYSEYIFGSNQLDFVLDGNNIDISYANKAFENLSGGEKQKVDLIIQFAIRDMMSEYLQFSSNILILDEIFDNLDSNGCNSVINLISRKLNDVESLFIISHHADELEISYDCEMVIQKDSNGISRVM